jgi:tetratricopeptide (TPR) repeat protein
MENLKALFKLIIYSFLFLSLSNTILAKNSDKFSDAEDISNYFSGILSINDNQYEKSYSYLKSLKNFEDNHYNYSRYYLYSAVTLNKFKDAINYSKKLENKKLDNFESNLMSTIYHLKKKDFKKASFYAKKIKKNNQRVTIQSLIAISLNNWIDLKETDDLNSALNLLNTVPKKFQNIQNIQKTFMYCYFDSPKTDKMFKSLTSNPDINYSRYNFFHANYFISKNNETKTKEVLDFSLKQYPQNLILNQLKIDYKKKIFNNKFNCKKTIDVIAEIFYITSSILSSQNNYVASNFYLNLAKYLNPNFTSFDTLHAENFFQIQEYDKAKKIYEKIKKRGLVYNWYSSKQITSIFIKKEKKEEAINYLKKSFKEIIDPNIYEIFDFAEFLKNNERFEESIEYYSKVLNLIGSKDPLYSKVMDSRGVAYERTNQWEKAEIDLLNSLKASPNNAYAINYLAYSWIEKGVNIQKSLEMLKEANNLKPNDGYIIDSLGWALFKLKKYKEAKKYLELAITYMASDPVVNDHYADALWMNNKSLQARYYWNYVLELKKTEEKLKKVIKQKLLFGIKS